MRVPLSALAVATAAASNSSFPPGKWWAKTPLVTPAQVQTKPVVEAVAPRCRIASMAQRTILARRSFRRRSVVEVRSSVVIFCIRG